MSHEPMFGEPMSSEPMSGGEPMSSEREPMSSEPAARSVLGAPASSGVGTDAALVLAALGRMEAAIRGDRSALARLRDALAEMARAIGRAKNAMQSDALKCDAAPADVAFVAAVLLGELEHRVEAMIEIAGRTPEAKANAPPAAVADVRAEPPAGAASDGLPTVPHVETAAETQAEPALVADPIAPAPPKPRPKVTVPDIDFELDHLLFGPETAGAEPPRAPARDLPTVDLVSPQATPATPPDASGAPTRQPPLAPDPNDPLAPVKALSEAERIALFS